MSKDRTDIHISGREYLVLRNIVPMMGIGRIGCYTENIGRRDIERTRYIFHKLTPIQDYQCYFESCVRWAISGDKYSSMLLGKIMSSDLEELVVSYLYPIPSQSFKEDVIEYLKLGNV